MTSATFTPSIAALPDPTLFFQRAINAMWNCGKDMLGRVRKAPDKETLPKRWRHPARAELRLVSTMDWILALARTLSGSYTYLLPAPRPEPTKPRRARKPRVRPARLFTEEEREEQRVVARHHYMCMVFATQPTERIAKRLARRLGAKEGTDWWPEELLTVTETPVAWAARTFPPIEPPPAEPPPTQPPLQSQPPNLPIRANPAPVAFHRRE